MPQRPLQRPAERPPRRTPDPGASLRTSAVVAIAAVAFHYLSLVLLPFVLAAIVAFVADPLVGWLRRRLRWPRWGAAALVFAALMLAGAAVAAVAAVSVAGDVARLSGQGPQLLHQAAQRLAGPGGETLFGAHLDADRLEAAARQALGQVLTPSLAGRAIPAALGAAVGAVLFVFLLFYLLMSGPELAAGARWLVPPSRRADVERVLPAMLHVLRRFYGGIAVIVAFTAAAAGLGYGLVFRVHGAVLLALALGVLETIPAVGPMVSAVLVAVAALQLHGAAAMLGMVAYAVGLRLVIDDLVAPLVLGRSVAVHPVVVMLAYALGAVLFGVTGLLLAVPVAACGRIALRYAYEGDASLPRR